MQGNSGISDFLKEYEPHLKELRSRLIRCTIVLVLCSCLSYFFSEFVFRLLTRPLEHVCLSQGGHSRSFIYTGLSEAFFVYIKISFFSGFFISFPFLVFHAWRFMAPALYDQERLLFLGGMIFSPILFIMGVGVAYFLILPLASQFFLSFEIAASSSHFGLQLQARLYEYVSFFIRLMVGFGLSFQFPLVIITISYMRGISWKSFLKGWRFFTVGAFVVAAIVAPPDLLSMVILAGLLMMLYGLSLLGVKCVEYVKKKSQ